MCQAAELPVTVVEQSFGPTTECRITVPIGSPLLSSASGLAAQLTRSSGVKTELHKVVRLIVQQHLLGRHVLLPAKWHHQPQTMLRHAIAMHLPRCVWDSALGHVEAATTSAEGPNRGR